MGVVMEYKDMMTTEPWIMYWTINTRQYQSLRILVLGSAKNAYKNWNVQSLCQQEAQ